ncbi:MAG: two pore domain potassium channel family protein, partial [Deltaproteobacteria bacterium]
WLYKLAGVDFGGASGPFSPFYFSIVTLTTLGYGDIHPQSTAGQVLASAEALLGYVGLGGLLSILANKLARRAE